MNLLNRSMIYLAQNDFVKAREDAVDAHEAVLERCGRRSTNLYYTASIAAKASKALADEIDSTENLIQTKTLPTRLKPRTIQDMLRKSKMTYSDHLRKEATEFERCAFRIQNLPDKSFMRSDYERARRSWDDDAEVGSSQRNERKKSYWNTHSTATDPQAEK
eukprot:PhF_6_TR20574/c0_g1_i1/m.29695